MKKLLLTTLALTGLAVQSFGQGEVLILAGSAPATRIYTTTNGTSSTDQSAGIAAGSLAPSQATSPFMFALFSANSSVSTIVGNPWTDPNWSFTGNYGTNTAAGRLTAMGPYSATGSGGVVVPGIAVGANASLVLIGWDVAHGGTTLNSFTTAFNAGTVGLFYGRSAIGNIVLGNGSTPPDSNLFGTTAGQVGGFTMGAAVVPEPATFALAGIGAAAMLIFRRRK